jgi:3',5'-cyclic AMP phosphodiesterase CpdA
MDDARQLLMYMLDLEPTVLVHLGDIYYSGTRREDACNFTDVLDEAFREVGRRVPVFAIPGNHDYYSGGRSFYELLGRLNPEPERQAASYFCLRSEDGGWQLVGVDTGFGDHRPGLAFDPSYVAPRLHDSEVEWLRHKLERFAGRTVLLSHHPLFSAHRPVNGPRSGRPSLNFNDALHTAVRPYLDRVAVWLWGHEHSLAIYEDGLHGLPKGRLVGCSAFEVDGRDDPYIVRFDDTPYRQPVVRLSVEHGWYDHGFAIIDMAGAEATIEYHQFPSWAGAAPASPPSPSLLYRERLDRR